jgi:flagella basal body P-ring formation protein FlgA
MTRERLNWLAAAALAWVFWAQLGHPAFAATAPIETSIRDTVEREALAGTRVAVEFPEAPRPPALAGCRQAEPFVPTGTRLWGRTAIGVRCIDGGTASAFLPVVIRVHARALTAARNLSPGTVLAPEDLAQAEVELTAGPGSVLADPRLAVGRTVARAIAVGSPLRPENLRVQQAVSPGDLVRVVYAGPGFTVTADAKALAAAQEGQSVRVQTDSGRVLTGTAKAGRVVEIKAF